MAYFLRPLRATDAPSLARYANDPDVPRYMTDRLPHPYSLADAEAFLKSVEEADPMQQRLWAIEVGGEAAGTIGVFLEDDIQRKSAKVGYWLGRPFWGQGIMARALREICDAVFDQFDICRLHASVFAPNVQSRRVLEKAGFVCEGTRHKALFKHGEIYDALEMALVR